MVRQTHLKAEFVDFVPDTLRPGILYISRRYSTASHLCCCGCGLEVVTPLNDAKWHFIEANGTVSLYPSIGNWSFPCKSHYWITEGHIRWAYEMSSEQVADVRMRDQRAVELHAHTETRTDRIRKWLHNALNKAGNHLRKWFRV